MHYFVIIIHDQNDLPIYTQVAQRDGHIEEIDFNSWIKYVHNSTVRDILSQCAKLSLPYKLQVVESGKTTISSGDAHEVFPYVCSLTTIQGNMDYVRANVATILNSKLGIDKSGKNSVNAAFDKT